MKQARIPLLMSIVLAAFLIGMVPSLGEKLPSRTMIQDVPYVEQLRNYCGPASLTSVLNYWKLDVDQESVGKEIFDVAIKATNGADMMLYARARGMSAYSWNSSLTDLKEKLCQGIPIIVLQDSSATDRSGHYRIAIGYDDADEVFYILDPYEPDKKQMSYKEFEALWLPHGHWALLICAAYRDIYKAELDEQNPVVHLDLAYVYFKKGKLDESERESRIALKLEPQNFSAKELLAKATRAAGARNKSNQD